MRLAMVFFGGLIVGAISMFVFTSGDDDSEQGDIDELEAAVLEAEEEADQQLASDEQRADMGGTGGDECQETLAMVSEAHAAAIEKYGENEEMVEYLEELVEQSGAGSPQGTAMEFPEQLDESFHPESFAQAVENLQDSCPDVFGDDTDVDCSEFPCIIEFKSDERPREIDFHDRCPALQKQFGQTGLGANGVELGDDVFIQLIPRGTGVGLAEHLDKYQGNLDRRMSHRWQSRRQQLSADRYEDPCMFEGDAHACQEMARALWSLPEEREVYLVLGCDERDAWSCHSYAHSRCIDRGRCDATSEEFARRAIALDEESETYHHTLGILLCERGQPAAAESAWQHACQLGHNTSCERRCEP